MPGPARRAECLLVHYDDLSADLEGQMRGIAGRLGIESRNKAWPAFHQAARSSACGTGGKSFSDVRERVKGTLPRSSAAAPRGAGREILSRRRKWLVTTTRAEHAGPYPDFLDWLALASTLTG